MSGIIAQNSGRHTGLVKASSGGTAVWNLIKTYTASSDADLTFVDGTDGVDFTAYDMFVFKFINIHPETDTADFQVNFRDEDSAYDATKTTHIFVASNTEAGSNSLARQDVDVADSTAVQVLGYSLNGDADGSLSGELKLWNPSSTTFTKNFGSRVTYMHSAPASYDAFMGGYCTQDDPSKAIDGVQFTMSTDSIQSGQISLYGIS